MKPEQALPPCPESPNCVCSLAGDARHGAAPIALTRDARSAAHAIVQAVSALQGAELVERNDPLLRFVFTSRVLRFKDDVAFFVDAENRVIHFRSASRVGWWDLGMNRRRMERVRGLLKGRV